MNLRIQTIIKEFAEKYNFIQEIDIRIIETSDFNIQNYRKIDKKPFISSEGNNIVFGRICIEIDTIDEEEWYSIEKNNYFILNTIDYENEDLLIETMTNECKKHNFIYL